MNGWIKLHKSITEHWLWDDPVVLKAWIDLLISVNYTDKKILFNGKLIVVKAGQILTSIRKLSERWGCTRRKANRIVQLFTEDNMVELKTNRNGTLLTIVNYGKYQDMRDTESTTQDTTQSTTQDTTEGTTESTQHKNIKNNKELKENKNNREGKSRAFTPPTLEEITSYCLERKNKVNPERFIDFYASKGWMVGKNKMKDWKAAVRTWEQRDEEQPKPTQAKPKTKDYSQRNYTDEEYKEMERRALGIT